MSFNPKNPLSVFVAIVFCAFWGMALAWMTIPLLDTVSKLDLANKGSILTFGITFIVSMVCLYWLYGGVIWLAEDWTGKDWDTLRPRGFARPNRANKDRPDFRVLWDSPFARFTE